MALADRACEGSTNLGLLDLLREETDTRLRLSFLGTHRLELGFQRPNRGPTSFDLLVADEQFPEEALHPIQFPFPHPQPSHYALLVCLYDLDPGLRLFQLSLKVGVVHDRDYVSRGQPVSDANFNPSETAADLGGQIAGVGVQLTGIL